MRNKLTLPIMAAIEIRQRIVVSAIVANRFIVIEEVSTKSVLFFLWFVSNIMNAAFKKVVMKLKRTFEDEL